MSRSAPTRLILLALLPVLLLASGCGYDENKGLFMAPGAYTDMALVVSSQGLTPLSARFLGQFNTTKTFVIKEEPLYLVDTYQADRWDLAKGYKNSIFLLRIGDGGPVEKEIRRRVDKETWEQLNQGGGGLVKLNDPWASYQLVVVVASRDRNNLGSLLTKNQDKIREIFTQSNASRIQRRNRYEGLATAIMDDNWQRFGFFMEVPADFERIQFLPDGFPAVEMMKKSPSRGITVSWQGYEGDWSNPLQEASQFLEMRRKMGLEVHNEEIHLESLTWSEETLNKQKVLKLEGAWTSNKFSGGGAFWSYFIPDLQNQKVYCVDLLVYAPGMDKMNFFVHLDAVAATFTTQRPRG